MEPLAIEAAGSKVEGRRSARRYVLLGVACLSVVSGGALFLGVMGLPLSWTADYDRAEYARINKAIAADPEHLRGRRLDDVSRELGLEDVPWDDSNVQNLPGSDRIYHFRGFALHVTLDYTREGVTSDMLLGRGSPEEKLRARDLLRVHPRIAPFVMIDGISNREERMRKYWTLVDKAIAEINKEMELERQRRQDRRD